VESRKPRRNTNFFADSRNFFYLADMDLPARRLIVLQLSLALVAFLVVGMAGHVEAQSAGSQAAPGAAGQSRSPKTKQLRHAKAKVKHKPMAAAKARPRTAHGKRRHAATHARAVPGRSGHHETGKASWYGSSVPSRRTASGERFDPQGLTAAHPSLPMQTRVRVRNLRNDKSVTVRINDRSGGGGGRVIDLTPHAAQELGIKRVGVAPVTVEALPKRAP
jgi:rare lipoprotein A